MPFPSDTQQQALLVAMLGDANGVLQTNMATLWAMHADTTNAALRFLLVKRDAVDMLIGTIRNDVTFHADGLTVQQSDKLKALQALRPTEQDIARAASVGDQRGQYASGQLTTTTPTTTPTQWIDPNNPRYGGSAYLPWPWRMNNG